MNFDFGAILTILVQFGELVGVAALLAVIINVFKYFGLVKDGTSGTWFAALSLISMAVLVAMHFFAPTVGIEFLDAQAKVLAEILTIVLGYLVQLKTGSGTAGLLKQMKIPVVGSSSTESTLLKSK